MSVYSLAPKLNSVQIEVNSKAPKKKKPTFTGTVTGINNVAVGLGSVQNTSDADKPVSTAVSNELATKAPTNNPTFTGTVTGTTQAMVGLGNVTNTSDSNKPVSTAVSSALAGKQNTLSPSTDVTVLNITAATGEFNYIKCTATSGRLGAPPSYGAYLGNDSQLFSALELVCDTIGYIDVTTPNNDFKGRFSYNIPSTFLVLEYWLIINRENAIGFNGFDCTRNHSTVKR